MPTYLSALRLSTKVCLAFLAVLFIIGAGVYSSFSRLVDRKLKQGPYAGSVSLYSEPRALEVGDSLTADSVILQLRQSGYGTNEGNPMGFYRQTGGSVEVHPGSQSYFRAEPAKIGFEQDHVSSISSIKSNAPIGSYSLEPQTIALIDGSSSGKRRLVRFQDVPKILVNALLAIEDKHFFEHAGFDPLRIVKSAYIDIRSGRKEQGGSTLSMQLARNMYLDSAKSWRRKASELAITLVLEQKLSKQQIFELYANQVYLGRHYGFTIQGFGEAAHVFFGKQLSRLTLPEAALLAGLVQRPSYFDPVNHLERATDRRNLVLSQMLQNGAITAAEAKSASETPIALAPPAMDGSGSPYFLSLVNKELQSHLAGSRASVDRIYTTLDPDLQKAAVDSIAIGMGEVDKQLARKEANSGTRPEVALLAMDPHTGAVLAAVGGRNFSTSQVHHILAMRQPGSVFKPFVYAAALAPAEDGVARFTAASTVVDEPYTFHFDNIAYQPGNFGGHFHGRVTFRNALAKSMNVAAVRVAEEVGFSKVIAMAKAAGIDNNIQATPAVALGAYEATPLEIAGAYTIFANQGEYVQPTFVSQALTASGKVLYSAKPARRRVLTPGTAWIMQDMLEEVMRSGTAVGVKKRGLLVEAAGKNRYFPRWLVYRLYWRSDLCGLGRL